MPTPVTLFELEEAIKSGERSLAVRGTKDRLHDMENDFHRISNLFGLKCQRGASSLRPRAIEVQTKLVNKIASDLKSLILPEEK